jgi:hypothetical protein
MELQIARVVHETGPKQRKNGTHRLDLFTAIEKLALQYTIGYDSLTKMQET